MIALTASAIRVPKLNKKKTSQPGQSAFGESPGLLAADAQTAGRRRGESDAGFHGPDLTTDLTSVAILRRMDEHGVEPRGGHAAIRGLTRIKSDKMFGRKQKLPVVPVLVMKRVQTPAARPWGKSN
jgi:hypothetical protein